MAKNIHLDYLQKPPKRLTEIVGTEGRIEFDYYANKAILFTHNNIIGEEFKVDNNFDRNDMFLEEMKQFINSIKSNELIKNCWPDSPGLLIDNIRMFLNFLIIVFKFLYL